MMRKMTALTVSVSAIFWLSLPQLRGISFPIGSTYIAVSAAHEKGEVKSWSDLVHRIERMMDEAHQAYKKGDKTKAKEIVSESYFGAFEADGKGGMEAAIRTNISARTMAEVESMFDEVRQTVVKGKSPDEMRKTADTLVKELRKYAAQLEKERVPYSENPFK